MSFRLRAFSRHVFASLCVVTIVAAVLYAGWYRWPAWYLLGAESIVGLLVLVDIGLGPLCTLIVSSPNKPRSEWRRDVSLIVAVQLLALGYGVHALWLSRPLYHVFSLDRIELVRAGDFKDEAIETARQQGAVILPDWQSLPRWIWAPLPDDPDKRNAIISSAIFGGGDDVTVMPEYFRPWPEGLAALRQALIPLDHLTGLKNLDAGEHRKRLAQLNRPESSLGLLPAKGSRRDGAWVFDRETGEPLAFWPVDIWSLRTPQREN